MPTPQIDLNKKPQTRSSTWGKLLLVVGLTAIILLGGGIILWQVTARQPANHVTQDEASSSNSKGKNTACGPRLPMDSILQEIANQLQMNLDQVKQQVRAGKKLRDLAAGKNISLARLHTIEIQAFEDGNNQWQRQGCLSPQDYKDNQQRYSVLTPLQLDDEVTDRLTH